MNSRFSTLAACALVTGALAPIATAAPLSKATLWRTPKLTVTCGIEIHSPGKPATKVLCGAQGIPAPAHGGSGDPGFVQLGVSGKPQLLRLSQDSFVAAKTETLGSGRLWSRLGVTCHVALSTVMCFNSDNHGFVIGNRHYRSF